MLWMSKARTIFCIMLIKYVTSNYQGKTTIFTYEMQICDSAKYEK